MKAMIFAAGLGTRLRPFTLNAPKALYPLCGKPLLYWVAKAVASTGEVDEIVVNVHHFSQMIVSYLSCDEFVRAFPGIRFLVSDESDCLLDTGGGLLKAESLLSSQEPILLHNADIVSDADLRELCMAHLCSGAAATLLVSGRPSSRQLLFDSQLRLCGWHNLSTGQVRSPLIGFSPEDYIPYAFSGIHIVSADVFAMMRQEGFSGKFPIMDFYLKACSRIRINGFPTQNLAVADAGKLENMPSAEKILLVKYGLLH